MGNDEVTGAEQREMQLTQLVVKDEVGSQEEAVEDVLAAGVRAYKASGPMEDEGAGYEEDGMMGHDDEYVC